MGLDKKNSYFLFPISCHPLHQIYLEKDIRSFDGANFWLKMTQNHRKKKTKNKKQKNKFLGKRLLFLAQQRHCPLY